MISKERLEELIEQGATVYSTFWREEVNLSLPCEICGSIKKDLCLIVHEDKEHNPSYMLKNLTEDIEGAKWEEEFGCIEKTERLELPTWEEVTEIIYGGSFGIQTIKKFDKCKFGYKLQLDGNVYIFVDKGFNTLFMGSLTKENYTIACRKAKELFLGEKI